MSGRGTGVHKHAGGTIGPTILVGVAIPAGNHRPGEGSARQHPQRGMA